MLCVVHSAPLIQRRGDLNVEGRTLRALEVRLLQIRCFDELVDKGIRVRPCHLDPAEDWVPGAILRLLPAL